MLPSARDNRASTETRLSVFILIYATAASNSDAVIILFASNLASGFKAGSGSM
jgi:hypothetical protein